MSGDKDRGEYLIEFQQHGASVKVSAIDPATMTEVSIVGPSTAGREELARTAVQKLHFVLKRNRSAGEGDTKENPPASKGPGIIV